MGSHHHHHHHHGHGHSHGSQGAGDAKSSTSMLKVFALNLSFSILELVGGLWTGSLALLADALHDFGDALSIGLAVILEKKAEQKPDAKFSYGYRRYSLLSALITGTVLLGGSLGVILAALPKFQEEQTIMTLPMLGFAFFGVLVNGISFLQLKPSSQHNTKMLRWHLLEDTAGWIAVLFGAAIMHFTHWYWVDAALALGIAAWILINVARSWWQTVEVFLQGVPSDLNSNEIRDRLQQVQGVQEIHDFHLWSLDGQAHVLSLHIVLENSQISAHKIKNEVRDCLKHFGQIHVTIEIEMPEEDCREQC